MLKKTPHDVQKVKDELKMKGEIEQKAYLIDQIVAVDIPKRVGIRELYKEARKVAKKPLCHAAAEQIVTASEKGNTVFIITGFPVLPKNVCETDGPPGAVVLAEALRDLKLKPLIITDEACANVVKAISQTTPVFEFPINDDLARAKAEQLFSEFNPSLLISIERPGWNKKKVYHNMAGLNISDVVGKTDYLFELGRRHGVVTVAVGDGGNELGFGTISKVVEKYVPYGSKCQCKCNGGIATTTAADSLVIARTSNWGGYGIAGCIYLLKRWNYTHDGKKELKMLRQINDAGGIDSVTKKAEPSVDGLPPRINSLIADLIFRVVNA